VVPCVFTLLVPECRLATAQKSQGTHDRLEEPLAECDLVSRSQGICHCSGELDKLLYCFILAYQLTYLVQKLFIIKDPLL
jgi:hypothetical protein